MQTGYKKKLKTNQKIKRISFNAHIFSVPSNTGGKSASASSVLCLTSNADNFIRTEGAYCASLHPDDERLDQGRTRGRFSTTFTVST